MSSRRFNDQRYIDEYLMYDTFPAIHDQVAHLIRVYASEHEPAFDLGSNIGLLSIRSVALGRSLCVGIEGGSDFGRAVTHPQVVYKNFFITRNTFDTLQECLTLYKPTLVIARRVLSEIGIKDPFVVTEMAKILKEFGVRKIILQGRVPVSCPRVPLHTSELEAKALEPYFKVNFIHKAAYYLEANESI